VTSVSITESKFASRNNF